MKEVAAMPTADPSLLPSLVSSVAAVFTSNWSTFLTATVALIGIVIFPTAIAKGGLKVAIRALKSVFHSARG
jgi:hypothetical protein